MLTLLSKYKTIRKANTFVLYEQMNLAWMDQAGMSWNNFTAPSGTSEFKFTFSSRLKDTLYPLDFLEVEGWGAGGGMKSTKSCISNLTGYQKSNLFYQIFSPKIVVGKMRESAIF